MNQIFFSIKQSHGYRSLNNMWFSKLFNLNISIYFLHRENKWAHNWKVQGNYWVAQREKPNGEIFIKKQNLHSYALGFPLTLSVVLKAPGCVGVDAGGSRSGRGRMWRSYGFEGRAVGVGDQDSRPAKSSPRRAVLEAESQKVFTTKFDSWPELNSW